MLKLGIRRLEDFPLSSGASRFKLRSPDRVSYQLLRTAHPPSSQEIRLFDHVMRQMQLSSGVFRTTVPQRFANLNPQIGDLLDGHFPVSAPLEVHDWAASSCLTSTEWAHLLFARFPSASLTSSDLTLYLLEATLPNGDVFVFERDGALLQFVQGPFVVSLVPREPRHLPVNSYLASRAQARFTRSSSAWHLPPTWLDAEFFETPDLQLDGALLRKIPIIHPEAMALARQDSRFRIMCHSAFAPLPAPVDVIRTMNIFNRSYFPPPRLTDGVRAVWLSLRPGGLWLVGRTVRETPAAHEVSAFIRTASGFQLVWRNGTGSEIEELALAVSFPF